MIKIRTFNEMTRQAERKIKDKDIENIKKTINMIFKSIRKFIYSKRDELQENSNEEIDKIAYKEE